MTEQNNTNILVQLSGKIGKLERGLEELSTHFSNHLHNHRVDRVLNVLYFALVVIMFCCLKWM